MLSILRFRMHGLLGAGALLLLSFVLFAPSAHAVCSVTLTDGDLIVSPTAPIVNNTVKLYVTVDPNCAQDLEGEVVFRADTTELGQKPFSYKSLGKPEEVWIGWTPTVAKTYLIQVDVNGAQEGDIIPASYTRSVLVDVDTDGDGMGDSIDTDDDNDGVLDVNDDFPLDPSKQTDTDGDGIDNSVDSDDDNDGVYDYEEVILKTNPENRDTDGDGVWDKQDAFPLDPSKSQEVSTVPVAVQESNSNMNKTTQTTETVAVGSGASETQIVEEPAPEETADEASRRIYVNAERNIEPVVVADEGVQAIAQEEPKQKNKATPWLWGSAAFFLSLSGFFLREDRKKRRSKVE